MLIEIAPRLNCLVVRLYCAPEPGLSHLKSGALTASGQGPDPDHSVAYTISLMQLPVLEAKACLLSSIFCIARFVAARHW